jgi:hypothetical protein
VLRSVAVVFFTTATQRITTNTAQRMPARAPSV